MSVDPAVTSLAVVRRWVLPVITAAFVMAGFFKAAPALAWLPFDLTVALGAVTAVAVVWRWLTSGAPRQVHWVVLGFAALLPVAFFTTMIGYGGDKVIRLFTLTLLATLAPVVLIRDSAEVQRYLWAWTGVSGIVVASALFDPQLSSGYQGAPVTAQGVDTIGLGVAAGLVVVVTAMGLVWSRIPWFIALPLGGCAVYVLLQSGSRGPLISAVVAVVVGTFLTRRRPPPLRSVTVGVLAGAGVLLSFLAAPLFSQQRILGLLEGDTSGSVDTRIQLYGNAVDSILRHPFGIGWGGFQRVSVAAYPYPHDLPLEVLAEAGVIFGGLFLFWLAMSIWRAHRATVDVVGGTTFALLVFLLGKAMVSGDINDNRPLFYCLGIAIAATVLARRRRSGPDHVSGSEVRSDEPVPATDGSESAVAGTTGPGAAPRPEAPGPSGRTRA